MARRTRNHAKLRGAECLEDRRLLAAQLAITEFLSANDSGLRDGFGETSDWIEINNGGDAAIDLHGYHLTDDPLRLAQWTFPENTMLGPSEFLVVFASGRDTVDLEGNLHTNFRLDREGEYVALTDPALNVLSSYGPLGADYPQQQLDVSYGTHLETYELELVAPRSSAEIHIPTAASPIEEWYGLGFEPDATWESGLAGIGFDRLANVGVPVTGGTAILQVDLGDDDSGESGPSDTEDGWTTITLSDSDPVVNGIRVTLSPVGGIPLDDRDRDLPVDDPPSLTVDQLFDDFVFARSQTDGTGLEVHLQGLVPGQSYEVTLWSYDTGSIGERVSTWQEVSGETPVEIEGNYQFDGRQAPRSDLDNTITARLTASASGELRIQGTRNGGSSYGVFLNALQVVVPSIASVIEEDLSTIMSESATSAQLRSSFLVPADLLIDELWLEMQYDSGFVAYLNGVEVARRNAPGSAGLPLAHDATATTERSVAQVLITEQLDLSAYRSTLSEVGPNVFAIHGLNSEPGDSDFLIRPRLIARSLGQQQVRYFSTPTPGEPNRGETFLGVVADTTFSVDRGFYDAPQQVTVTSATPGASLIYTLDGSVPSETNGFRVDALSGDVAPEATVMIDTTSYLRAIAIKTDYLPSNVDTQTYIFLEDVIRQDIDSGGDSPYPATWQSSAYTADYDMDPEVVAQWDDQNPDLQDTGIRTALKSIPTMSLVMEHDDLWDSSRGIYPRAQSQGTFWQRPASIEYFDPNTGEEFQVNAGVQMHGGASRDNERTKKHSFRLLFREDFGGPSELNFPLFKGSDIEQINTVVLKSFFTDGFPTRTITGRYSPLDSQYLRDTWMRDVRLAMGGLDAHSEYVHLYINGLYWGLYSPTERPDDAFMSEYLGAERESYDIVKDFNELFRGNKTAWNEMFAIADRGLTSEAAYQQIQGNDPDGSPNPDLPNYLDVDDLIDYMILHLFAGAEDWPHHNWYAARDREGETKGFRFFTWDQEIVLDGRYRDRTNVSDAYTPARLYARLRQNEEFRIRFGDRVYQHLFHEGALTVENAQRLWMQRADQIEAAIIAESARWGDAREGEVRRIDAGGPSVTIPTMTVDLWRAERDNVRDNYLPQSHQLAIDRFRQDEIFPTVDPPSFSQRGGLISSESPILLSGSGSLYYTLDGSDPRQTGGTISPQAILYEGPFELTEDTTVRTRALQDGEWSAIDQALFEVDKVPADARNLRIVEIHYHPLGDTETEFVELMNVGAQTVTLKGVTVTSAVEYAFSAAAQQDLEPGQRVLIVQNLAAFQSAYPDALPFVAGEYDGALSNAGETIRVEDLNGQLIQEVTYDDNPTSGWPQGPDGFGPSLQVIDPLADCGLSNCNWRASAVEGGTPGEKEFLIGDSNLDGVFGTADLVLVLQAGRYESPALHDANWSQGDWNGDQEFDTQDMVLALQTGMYEAGPVAATVARNPDELRTNRGRFPLISGEFDPSIPHRWWCRWEDFESHRRSRFRAVDAALGDLTLPEELPILRRR